MIDIALCTWKECPIGSNCYRLKATPGVEYQSYSDFKECFNSDLSVCSYKITMTKKGVRYGDETETYP